ncbi:MAG: hypothetical protein KH334_09560, partial [Clostridiales bacterium]|nr:hypothetical protein [Clostridiales bacterium]
AFLLSLVLLPVRLFWFFFSPAEAGMLSSVVLIGLFFKFTFLSVLFCARTNANHFALPKAILIF